MDLLNLGERIGKHFQLWEALHSDTAGRLGIRNYPSDLDLRAIRWVAKNLADPVREHFGPMRVSSWFRCRRLNAETPGSSTTSAHIWGGAVDFHPLDEKVLLRDVVLWIAKSPLLFDQCIFEYGEWVHLGAAHFSVFGTGKRPRREVLMKFKGAPIETFAASDERVTR